MTEDGWNNITTFVLNISKSLDIKEDGTYVSVTKFDDNATLAISFSANRDYLSFEKSVNALSYNGGGTETIKAIEFAFNKMFDVSNGMRPNVPKVLIFMTDGKCFADVCNKTIFQEWNARYRDPDSGKGPIKLIGIGIGPLIDPEQIKDFVGEENYFNSSITQILDPEFQKNLTVCDSMFIDLNRLVIIYY